ncbi:hypothetical protein N7U66_14470 [Lacinutrix neustonica]|uniref:Uncharacterized protein n=1 Tax=Lacinutrix neustonica TaxID=2980107 RepID=A0A9E8MUH6_9FLAO|nr:hypothetical protein [Lacinutrix neustonica]WAC01291.1 hypothetical protein N7U66_14470 [Lacinutrix neustonica]
MYTLTVNNNYIHNIEASNGVTISKNKKHTFNDRGSLVLRIPGMADMNFIDLADKKLPGYPQPKETWGVLVRYSNMEAYYRYEGSGTLNATFDTLGTCSLTTSNGSMLPISIREFVIETN